ncbi:acetoin reductase [Lacticaseibacillus porcinae]|uniref:acetoin reductase n=1 Tax=Lacticaseibacillus porcinae TaxID=1123687 RepID=UPI000F78989C|nr:acetoin reductase [Lacticaseibacillus porcinae]
MTQNLAIVTGAGQGIGEGIARRLAKDGFAIALADINAETVDAVTADLAAQGYPVKAYHLDVADRDAVFALVDQAVEDFGDLAVFINNAGEAFIDKFVDSDPKLVEHLISVNLLGTYWGIQAAATRFLAQGHGGRIVNAASLAGVEASALQSAYSASKFGIRGLTQSAAKELAKDQITVNAYNPGIVRTPLRDGIDKKTAAIKGLTVPQQQANCLTEIGLGREGTPEDVANLVSFLVGPDGGYTTGQSIQVDGGMHYL